MILTEQKINRIGRIYWRGSEYPDWNSNIPGHPLYVTTKPVYAISYSEDKQGNYKYLFQFYLKEKINIFNMRYRKDEIKLEDFCRVYKVSYLMNIFKYLKDEDWLTVLSIQERNIFIKLLKQLGYDGFFNIECVGGSIKRNSMTFEPIKDEMDLYGFSGLGIFDKKSLILNKTYFGWNQMKEISGVLVERKTQFNYIKKFLVNTWEPNKIINKEELKSRFFLLTKEEINNIVDNFDYEKEKEALKEEFLNSRAYNLKRLRDLERKRYR